LLAHSFFSVLANRFQVDGYQFFEKARLTVENGDRLVNKLVVQLHVDLVVAFLNQGLVHIDDRQNKMLLDRSVLDECHVRYLRPYFANHELFPHAVDKAD
jgi:hypothetical protein